MRSIIGKILFPIYVLILFTGLAFAVPASPDFFEAEQPDGEKITLKMQGDEFYGWTEDSQGYTVIIDTTTKEWFYAEQDIDGSLRASKYRVGRGKYPAPGTQKSLKKRNYERITEENRIQMQPAGDSNGITRKSAAAQNALEKDRPVKTLKHLVVLVEFSDRKFRIPNPKQAFENFFNQVGYSSAGARGSVQDYFKEVSYGTLIVETVVTDIVTLSSPSVYYAGATPGDGTLRANIMASEAFRLVNNKTPKIDFTQFDSDASNNILAVTIVYAGPGQEAGAPAGSIWSHAWNASPVVTTWDGKRLNRYNAIPELRGASLTGSLITTIGVSCHELGHAMLGLPDLYDTTYRSQGVGNFCLMGGGSWNSVGGVSGNSPAHLCAWSKRRTGMVTPTEISAQGTYTLNTAATDSTAFYKYSGASFNAKEYFLIENRQGAGFDAGMPGPSRGIIIWHIDENMSSNTNYTHYMVAVETADGSDDLAMNRNRGKDSHYFRSGNKTDFTDTTTPNSKNYSNQNANMPITNISATGPVMSFILGGGISGPVTGTISTINPAEGRRNTTVTVEINGANLLAGSIARLVRTGSSSMTATSVVCNSPNKLTATFNIANTAAIGYWDLLVSSTGYTGDIRKNGTFLVLGNSMAIHSVTPEVGIKQIKLNLSATGTDFQSGATIKLVSGATTLTGTNITQSGTTKITASFAIPSTVVHGAKFDLTITNPSGDYLTKPQAVTVIGLSNSDGFKYFPNPVKNGRITLVNPSQETATVTIYTYLGGKIKTIIIPAASSEQWDTKNENGDKVASGVYMCRIEYDSGNNKTIKIVVKR
ncbi:MAG: M6 family metalloprotease domain-containing protein [Endomicrobia bacterium]|nr:M6 family metalloprotease domain-containing protein [Endomicrobiia bacterium]